MDWFESHTNNSYYNVSFPVTRTNVSLKTDASVRMAKRSVIVSVFNFHQTTLRSLSNGVQRAIHNETYTAD